MAYPQIAHLIISNPTQLFAAHPLVFVMWRRHAQEHPLHVQVIHSNLWVSCVTPLQAFVIWRRHAQEIVPAVPQINLETQAWYAAQPLACVMSTRHAQV